MERFIYFFESLSIWVGRAFGWCILILTLSVTYEVFVRYVLNAPTVWVFDMMVQMYGGLFLMAGALQVLLSAKKSYLFNEELSWIQENARFAVEFITRDARMAGYFGCGSGTIVNTLNTTTGWEFKFDQGMGGFDGDDASYPSTDFSLPPTPAVTSGTFPKSDVFTVLRGATEGESYNVTKHVTASSTIELDGNPAFAKGRILMISDCNHAAVFQHTGNNPGKAVHNPGGSTIPGNCTKGLGYPKTCTTQGVEYKYGGDAYVMEVLSHAYFIKTASNGVPAIYRQEITGGVTTLTEELVQGIESMQTFFGEDTDDDGVANRYVSAKDVTDWTTIVSLRLHLLTRSLTQVASEAQPFRFVGTTYTPTDRYLRKEFITTVKIRNRGV